MCYVSVVCPLPFVIPEGDVNAAIYARAAKIQHDVQCFYKFWQDMAVNVSSLDVVYEKEQHICEFTRPAGLSPEMDEFSSALVNSSVSLGGLKLARRLKAAALVLRMHHARVNTLMCVL